MSRNGGILPAVPKGAGSRLNSSRNANNSKVVPPWYFTSSGIFSGHAPIPPALFIPFKTAVILRSPSGFILPGWARAGFGTAEQMLQVLHLQSTRDEHFAANPLWIQPWRLFLPAHKAKAGKPWQILVDWKRPAQRSFSLKTRQSIQTFLPCGQSRKTLIGFDVLGACFGTGMRLVDFTLFDNFLLFRKFYAGGFLYIRVRQ